MTEPIKEKTPGAAGAAGADVARRPPPGADGYPSRAPDLDALPGFVTPPPGYGEVPFFWWMGAPLDKARLAWQLDRLAGHHISGLQINYAHDDRGGRSFGLTYPSTPPLFSDAWWKLFGWFMDECRKRGMAVGMSDYTLCAPGQGGYADAVIAACPDIRGAMLDAERRELGAGAEWAPDNPAEILAVYACRKAGAEFDPKALKMLPACPDAAGVVRLPPGAGPWQVVVVRARPAPLSIDPMHPQSGRRVIEEFFAAFERRCPGAAGRGLNFFFSDELDLGVRGKLWNRWFAAEFARCKGYDIRPELPALFFDVGARTAKVRLDYNDVLVALAERHYFQPIFEWHQQRGMLYGCDHGGRGRQVLEFGDYFRTQRWMTAPGNDAPACRPPDIVKNKVNSSIAHLYQRPRVWLEGFHSSGWGTDTETLMLAVLRNYVAGSNLLSLHGLYYDTGGGWWEWAPPCNHFRMPYWRHMRALLRCTERLSYLLSQGVHCCDVAILYPVAPAEAGMGGDEAARLAFTMGGVFFHQALDFDFLDSASLARAVVARGQLEVGGEHYRVLVLPALRAIRHADIVQALAFYRAGGVVLAVGALPEADDRAGAQNPRLAAMVDELFDRSGAVRRHAGGGASRFIPAGTLDEADCARAAAPAAAFIRDAVPPDFTAAAPCNVCHRKIGARDLYMVLGAPRATECFFRACGRVEIWDPWTGRTTPVPGAMPVANGTRLNLPLEAHEPQLLVFTPGAPAAAPAIVVQKTACTPIRLDGMWEFELAPTLDNHWGDFRLPASDALIGAEARHLRYAENLPGHAAEDVVVCGFGQRFWMLGPWPKGMATAALESRLAMLRQVDPAAPVDAAGSARTWRPYAYSWREGIFGDPGHQGYHGLKQQVSDEFIAIGVMRRCATDTVYEPAAPDDGAVYFWTTVRADARLNARLRTGGMAPAAVWLAGRRLDDFDRPFELAPGCTALLLRYDSAGRGYAVIETDAAPANWRQTHPLAMRWYRKPGRLEFDPRPADTAHVGHYRFIAPPGLRAMEMAVHGRILSATVDGVPAVVRDAGARADGARTYQVAPGRPAGAAADVALAIQQYPGCYGGAAIPDPIRIECGSGPAPLGDWSQMGVLQAYSGGVWYRKNFRLESPVPAGARVMLDLGRVRATAEAHVNGRPAGVRVAPPWRFDVTGLIQPGENRLEVLVCNTLANHYTTIPTRYRGALESGLMGPVTLSCPDA